MSLTVSLGESLPDFAVSNRRSIRRVLREHPWVPALGIFSLLAVIWTWPLATRLGDAVLGQVGDNAYFIWLIGWIQRALFQGNNPVNVPHLNYPEGWSIAYTEMTPATVIMVLPFSLLGGPTLAYNLAVLISFPLSALAAFSWARRSAVSFVAALIAGVVFGFSPFRFMHALGGHLPMLGMAWIAWFLLSLSDLISSKTWTGFTVVRVAFFFVLIAWTSQYYLYMTSIIGVVWIAASLLWLDPAPRRTRSVLGRLAISALLAAPLVAVSIWPYVELASRGGLAERSLAFVRTYSASVTDFMIPPTFHALWGDWIGANFARDLWIEATLYVGLPAVALGAIAVLKRHSTLAGARQVLLLAVVGLAAAVLAMGTDLHWLSRPVEIHLPAPGVLGRQDIPLVLPGYILYQLLPFYSLMRVAMRYGAIVLLAVSLLAAMGADWLLGRVQRPARSWVGLGLIGLLTLDFLPAAQPLSRLAPRAVDSWIADRRGTGAIVDLPFSQAQYQEEMYWSTTHGRPVVGGYFNAFPAPAGYERIRPVLETFPSSESVALLADLGVEYAVLDSEAYPGLIEHPAEFAQPGLELAAVVDGQVVYRVLP